VHAPRERLRRLRRATAAAAGTSRSEHRTPPGARVGVQLSGAAAALAWFQAWRARRLGVGAGPPAAAAGRRAPPAPAESRMSSGWPATGGNASTDFIRNDAGSA